MSPPWVPLMRYHPELEVPEWDEECQFKSPFLVDGNGCKIRQGRYASLQLQNQEIKSMVQKHQKNKISELPNVLITVDLEDEMDIVLQKRRKLIENRHNAVLVEDRTLHIELWNLIVATLLVLAIDPKERPDDGFPLREWPSVVRNTWQLIQRNHRQQKRWSVGWQSAKLVTGEDGAAISRYSQATKPHNPEDDDQDIADVAAALSDDSVWERRRVEANVQFFRPMLLDKLAQRFSKEEAQYIYRLMDQSMQMYHDQRPATSDYVILAFDIMEKTITDAITTLDALKCSAGKDREKLLSIMSLLRAHLTGLHLACGSPAFLTMKSPIQAMMEAEVRSKLAQACDPIEIEDSNVSAAPPSNDKMSPQHHGSQNHPSPDESNPPIPARQLRNQYGPAYKKEALRRHVGITSPAATSKAANKSRKRRRAQEDDTQDSNQRSNPRPKSSEILVNLPERVSQFQDLVSKNASSEEYKHWCSSLMTEVNTLGARIETGDLTRLQFINTCTAPISEGKWSDGDYSTIVNIAFIAFPRVVISKGNK
ncbi:hypothetical protein FRC03_003268 [Tulasnella sp. 419]|nr:hypothetical protein FRC03_003268 [Tulasnella sp. 419]